MDARGDHPTTPTDLIALVRETSAAVRAREADLLVLATVWADAHPDLEADAENAAGLRRRPTESSRTTIPMPRTRTCPRWRGMRVRRSRPRSGCPPARVRR